MAAERDPGATALGDDAVSEYLRRIYFALDGQWYLKSRAQFGPRVAQEVDELVCASLARIQLKTYCELTGSTVEDLDAFGGFVVGLLDALYGDHRDAVEVLQRDPDAFVMRYHTCTVFSMGRAAGFEGLPGELPGCGGILAMSASWAEAAGFVLERLPAPAPTDDAARPHVACVYRFTRG